LKPSDDDCGHGYAIDLEVEANLTVKKKHVDPFLINISVNFLNRHSECEEGEEILKLEDQKITGLKNKYAMTEHYLGEVHKRDQINQLKIIGVMSVNLMRLRKNPGLENANLYDHWNSFTDDDKEKFGYELKFMVQSRDFKADKKAFCNASVVICADLEQSKAFVIDDIKPEIFEIILHFVHGDQMNFDSAFKNEMVFDVLKVAIKYQMHTLMDYLMALVFTSSTTIERLLESYTFAWLHQLGELKLYCWECIQL
jgi:hypothetical protein